MLNPLAIATQGIGFNPLLISVQGLLDVEERKRGGGSPVYRRERENKTIKKYYDALQEEELTIMMLAL
jgi:hypothetical protein